jgi:hypothetical protein
MTTFGRIIISALAVFGLMGHAAANAAPDLTGKKSGTPAVAQSGQTRLTITQDKPGEADLQFTNIAGIVLNRTVVGESFTEPDKSGKGTSHVIPGAVFEGKSFILSGVGPDWAGTGSEERNDLRFDTSMTYQGTITGASVTIHLKASPEKYGTAFALIPVIVEKDGSYVAWSSYPAGGWHFVTRHNGTKDMVLIIALDKSGKFRLATDEDVKTYRNFYNKNT